MSEGCRRGRLRTSWGCCCPHIHIGTLRGILYCGRHIPSRPPPAPIRSSDAGGTLRHLRLRIHLLSVCGRHPLLGSQAPPLSDVECGPYAGVGKIYIPSRIFRQGIAPVVAESVRRPLGRQFDIPFHRETVGEFFLRCGLLAVGHGREYKCKCRQTKRGRFFRHISGLM